MSNRPTELCLRFTLYCAILFLSICFVLFIINYFQIAKLEYFQATGNYTIVFIIYLAILIFFGYFFVRDAGLSLAFYRWYLAILVIGVMFTAIFLLFDLDKTSSIVKKLEADIDYVNENNDKYLERLDYLQVTFECCGLESSRDYLKIPKSCFKKFELNRSYKFTRPYSSDAEVLEDYFKEGCLGKLERTHFELKSITTILLSVIFFSAILAAILTNILIFAKKKG